MVAPLDYDEEILQWAQEVLRDASRWAPLLALDADLAAPHDAAVEICPEDVDRVVGPHSYPAYRLDCLSSEDNGFVDAGSQSTFHTIQIRAFVRARKRAHADDMSLASATRLKAARQMRAAYYLLERAGMEPAAPGFNVEPQAGVSRSLIVDGGASAMRLTRTIGIWQDTESGRGRLAIPSP